MLSIEIPRYFYLDPHKQGKLSEVEIDFEKRMKSTVIYVEFGEETDDEGAPI